MKKERMFGISLVVLMGIVIFSTISYMSSVSMNKGKFGGVTGNVVGDACVDDSGCNVSLGEFCPQGGFNSNFCTLKSSVNCSTYYSSDVVCLADAYGFGNDSQECVWVESVCMTNITAISGDGCISNWTAMNTSCNSDETYTTYYVDDNDCGDNTGITANETGGCDYDGNGIVGGSDNEVGTGLRLVINNSELNSSIIYGGVQEVDIRDGDNVLIEFDWDFSDALAPSDISIILNSNDSAAAFMIINGLDVEKTVYLDIISDSGELCIIDDDIGEINEISANCAADDEIFLVCPGTSSGLTCNITNGSYIVSGLDHSGVLELDSLESDCTVNWTCGSWSTCVSSFQTRTCIDTNYCNVSTERPSETQDCGRGCTPLWTCDSWEDCFDGGQTRTCSDTNNCGVSSGKPAETQDCNEGVDFNYGLLFIIIGVLILVGIVVAIIIYFLNKQADNSESEDLGNGNNFNNGGPPSMPPAMPPSTSPKSVNPNPNFVKKPNSSVPMQAPSRPIPARPMPSPTVK